MVDVGAPPGVGVVGGGRGNKGIRGKDQGKEGAVVVEED